MSERKDLLLRIKKMKYADLISLRSSMKKVSALFTIAGVATILGILFFMNIFTLMVGGLLVYVLAQFSVISSFIQSEISIAMERLET